MSTFIDGRVYFKNGLSGEVVLWEITPKHYQVIESEYVPPFLKHVHNHRTIEKAFRGFMDILRNRSVPATSIP